MISPWPWYFWWEILPHTLQNIRQTSVEVVGRPKGDGTWRAVGNTELPLCWHQMRSQRLLLGFLTIDNGVPRARINPSQNRLLNQILWQAAIINATIPMQWLGMFKGCNSWLNKEGIFGRPCGMGHCFAERQNEIRALTLHQTYSLHFTWLEGSRLTVQGSIIPSSPIQRHYLLIFFSAPESSSLTLSYSST